MNKKQYILAVPSFSNGREQEIISAITSEAAKVPDVKLVSAVSECFFNRTVLTIIGEPQPIKSALIRMGKKAVELIDMRTHPGGAPGIGSVDNLPVYPLLNISMKECTSLAEEIGEAFFKLCKVPVFFSGNNARTPSRASFAYLCAGQFGGLQQLLAETRSDPSRQDEYNKRKPDYSVDGLLHERAGGTIVSCEPSRQTNFNIYLGTEDIVIAKAVAQAVRGPSGGFTSVRALGIKFPEHPGVAVSMNLYDCMSTPIPRVLEFCKREASRYGVNVTGSQIVGPVKLESIVASFSYMLTLENFAQSQVLETHLIEAWE